MHKTVYINQLFLLGRLFECCKNAEYLVDLLQGRGRLQRTKKLDGLTSGQKFNGNHLEPIQYFSDTTVNALFNKLEFFTKSLPGSVAQWRRIRLRKKEFVSSNTAKT
jgi:hypothetical protein